MNPSTEETSEFERITAILEKLQKIELLDIFKENELTVRLNGNINQK